MICDVRPLQGILNPLLRGVSFAVATSGATPSEFCFSDPVNFFIDLENFFVECENI